MTSKEKRDIVMREVVKPELKRAGYRARGKAYISMRDGCFLAIDIRNSRFNSKSTGFTFEIDIQFYDGDFSEERIKSCSYRDFISVGPLLPDCGYLHPYRQGSGYTIDGYKDYQPQDMDVEDIKNRIEVDLRCYILPQLTEINCYEDWKRKIQEWNQHYYNKRVNLLNFYSIVQLCAVAQANIPHLLENWRQSGLSADEIKDNYPLYQEIKALSPWPNEDKWDFMLGILRIDEETEL